MNCGEKNYLKVDHRSYRRNFCSFFFRLSFRNCSVVILNPADTTSYEISVAPSAISDIQCIQLFQERLSEKVHATIPKGIVGGFEFTVPQRNLREWHERPWIYVCQC